MTTDVEQVVLDFVHAAYGDTLDVEAMTALMTEDFEWRLNVPLSPVVKGREAARVALERQAQLSTGMVEGSEILNVVSSGSTVVVERIDVNSLGGKRVTFHVAAIFEVRDGLVAGWREYWDTQHVAQQLGIDASKMFAAL